VEPVKNDIDMGKDIIDCMDDPATGKINKDGHIAVTFTDTELIDAKSLDIGDRDSSIHLFQFDLVNILDHVPTDPEDRGEISNSHVFEHILNIQSKGSDKAVAAKHE